MPIEPIGARHAYAVVYHGLAFRQHAGCIDNCNQYAHHFVAADSDDEARGLADRLARILFPDRNGWSYRAAHVVRLDDVATVERVNESMIRPIPNPWGSDAQT
jgi:hypothetical protein